MRYHRVGQVETVDAYLRQLDIIIEEARRLRGIISRTIPYSNLRIEMFRFEEELVKRLLAHKESID